MAADPLGAVAAVSDHVSLHSTSPLRGPNDDRFGPRFPGIARIYAPEVVLERCGGVLGVTISASTVAGVRDDGSLSAWEQEMTSVLDISVVSAELVPVAIVAAHLGFRLAAAVVMQPS